MTRTSDDMVTSLAATPSGRRLLEMYADTVQARDGSARQAMWDCEDGYVVVYSTERVEGGPEGIRGRFATMLYKPIGRGARTGKAQEWVRVYMRGYSKRKLARARAEALYYRHSPKAAKRHGVTV